MPDPDILSLVLDALGKRIDDPAAQRLAEALGKKPFKSVTPTNDASVEQRKLGLEIGLRASFTNRAFFPPQKEGRTWVTRVSHAFVYPKCPGRLPAGFDWQMDQAALDARFVRRIEGAMKAVRYTLPAPREGLRAKAMLGDDGKPDQLLLAVDEERAYATVHPGDKPALSVEEAFFASWCALNGVLREDRLAAARIEALRQRSLTPQAFFLGELGGLLWEGDVRPEHAAFYHAYMNRLMVPGEASAQSDIEAVFGDSNAWRKPDEAPTEDSWANFDRIAPRYAERLAQWQRGEIRSKVDHPAQDAGG